MNCLKNDFVLVLSDKYKEGQLAHAHKHGLWNIFATGRRISQQPEIREDKAKIDSIFEDEWDKVVENLEGGAKIDKMRWTNWENLTKTFRGVNKFMPTPSAE